MPSGNNAPDVDVKPELHLLQRADIAEINAILNDEASESAEENEVNEENGNESDDDIEVVIIDVIFPQPVQYSSDDLLKRENDPVSGNLAFSDTSQVCIHVKASF